MKLYIVVTKDEFEYTLASAETQKELAQMLGVNPSVICRGIKRDKRGGRSKYREIEVDDDQADIHNAHGAYSLARLCASGSLLKARGQRDIRSV